MTPQRKRLEPPDFVCRGYDRVGVRHDADALPRYCHRALPPYPFLPGRDPHPTADPRGHSAANAPWFPVQACAPEHWAQCPPYLYGVDCFNHGYWWEAHEAWEPLWRGLDPASIQGHYVQGLIQAANALLKRRLGWAPAVARLRAEAQRHLLIVNPEPYMGLRVTGWAADLHRDLGPEGRDFPLVVLETESAL